MGDDAGWEQRKRVLPPPLAIAYLKVLAIQPLYSSDSAKGECEATSAWAATIGLAGKSGGG
jgi:hypothetical protein